MHWHGVVFVLPLLMALSCDHEPPPFSGLVYLGESHNGA
jgi:hypothetical protein